MPRSQLRLVIAVGTPRRAEEIFQPKGDILLQIRRRWCGMKSPMQFVIAGRRRSVGERAAYFSSREEGCASAGQVAGQRKGRFAADLAAINLQGFEHTL